MYTFTTLELTFASLYKRAVSPMIYDLCTYLCKPFERGWGRGQGNWGFGSEIHLLSRGFDRVPLLQGGDI